jgi:Bifunctional DNA primase/polymerase, N-terminal/AAA domain
VSARSVAEVLAAPMALFYAGAGVPVFPVNERKEPLTGKGGFHHATTEREQIEDWWKRWPDAGIATPAFDVVDVDLYKPACRETWQRIRSLLGDGPHSRTPRGGLQYFYAPGTLRRAKIGPGVDNRYAGSNYVLLPPSRFVWEDGEGRYKWVVRLPGRKVKPAPDFPIDANGGGSAAEIARKIKSREPIEDDRNTTAFWYAVGLIEQDAELSQAAVEAQTQAFVDIRCGGNLAEVDVAKQVRGAFTFVANKQGDSPHEPGPAPPADGPVFIDLRDVQIRDIDWIDRPFLPAGELVTNNADGDTGKGLLAVHFTARISRGEFGEPRMCVFAVAEDAFETVLKPRLLAAGANLAYVRALGWRRAGTEDALLVPDDVPLLEQAIAGMGVRLLVIDPLLSHLSGKTNSHTDHEVKLALRPLMGLAHRVGCCVLGNGHFSKDRTGGARRAASGSTAFTNTPDPGRARERGEATQDHRRRGGREARRERRHRLQERAQAAEGRRPNQGAQGRHDRRLVLAAQS